MKFSHNWHESMNNVILQFLITGKIPYFILVISINFFLSNVYLYDINL